MKKLMFAIAMMVAAGAAMAAVSFSYQGVLRTAEGEPIPTDERNKTITFRLYDSPTAGKLLWGRMLAVHLDDNGLFNVELSDGTGSQSTMPKPFTNDLAWVLSQYPGKEQELYIGLDVLGSSGEIRPRQKLLNVPAAAFAADVSQAKGDFTVTGKATVEGSITAKKGLEVSDGTLMIGAGVTISRSGDTANGIIPTGVIVMWSGAADKVPKGWLLCNGEKGTPDLRNRFIVGAGGKYDLNAKGGEETVTLSADQIPSHNHAFQAIFHVFEAEGNETTTDYYNYGYAVRWVGTRNVDSNAIEGSSSSFKRPDVGSYNSSEKDTNVRVDTTGGGASHNNMPPYYALCFIMKQ